MQNYFKFFILFNVLAATSIVWSQSKERDVPYTKALYTFIDHYYNNQISSMDMAEEFYITAVDSLPECFTEYSKLVHLSRCEFYLGMYVMGEYDFSSIEKIKSITDTTDNTKNLSQQIKNKKAQAASYFDKAISLAQEALKIREGSDAYIIYAMAISSNCTVKNSSYVINNGLKVGSYSKKALQLDSTNGTACYYQYAQDLYAPAFFSNYKRGYSKMLSFYNNDSLRKEKMDNYYFITGIAYSFYKTNNYPEALEWYKKSLEIYPNNQFALKMIKLLSKI